MTTLADLGFTPLNIKLIFFLASAIFLLSFLLGALFFYLKALGIQRMSDTFGIKNGWLGFVPVIGSYQLGKISDRRRTCSGFAVRPLAKLLLALNIASVVMCATLFSFFYSAMIDLVFDIDKAVAAGTDISGAPKVFEGLVPIFAAAFIVTVVFKIAEFVALRRIYAMFSPKNAVLMLVLSVIFSFLPPVFLFSIRRAEPELRSRSENNDGSFTYGV